MANPIQPSDPVIGSSVLHTDIRLIGHNYHEWAFPVCMLLQSVGLASHLIDDLPDEATTVMTVVKAWRVADDHVMGILCMSTNVSIRISFVDHLSAKEI